MSDDELRDRLAAIQAKLDELDMRTLPLEGFGMTNELAQLEQRVRMVEGLVGGIIALRSTK